MKELFLILSVIVEILAYLVYIKAIFKGQAKPHRTTRFVLLVLANIAAFSLFAQGSYVALWLAGVFTVFSWVLFLLSLKFGMGGWEKIDIVCLVIAVIGIILWKITDNPTLALYASIVADFMGMIPTILKSYYKPRTEVWYFFFLGGFGAVLNLLAIKIWTPQQYIFPLYVVFINTIMVSLLLRKKH